MPVNYDDILERLRTGKAVKQSEFTALLRYRLHLETARALEERFLITNNPLTLSKAREIRKKDRSTEQASGVLEKQIPPRPDKGSSSLYGFTEMPEIDDTTCSYSGNPEEHWDFLDRRKAMRPRRKIAR